MSADFVALCDAFYATRRSTFDERLECAITSSTRKFATLGQCRRVANGELKLPSSRGNKKWPALAAHGQFPDNVHINKEEWPHLWRFPTHVPMYTITNPALVAVMYSALRLCDSNWLDCLSQRQRARVAADARVGVFVDVFRRRLVSIYTIMPLDELNELASVHAKFHFVQSPKNDADELGDRELRTTVYKVHKAVVECGLAQRAKKRQAYARACFWVLFAACAPDEEHINTFVRRVEMLYTATRRATADLRAALSSARLRLAQPSSRSRFARHCFANFTCSPRT